MTLPYARVFSRDVGVLCRHQRECVDGGCWGLTLATCFIFCSSFSSWGGSQGQDRTSGCESPLPSFHSGDAVHRHSLDRLNAIHDFFLKKDVG